jgi:hypothetical protein
MRWSAGLIITKNSEAGQRALRDTLSQKPVSTPIRLHCSMWLDTITLRRRCATCIARKRSESYFVRLGNLLRLRESCRMRKSVQNRVRLETPSDADLVKILNV